MRTKDRDRIDREIGDLRREFNAMENELVGRRILSGTHPRGFSVLGAPISLSTLSGKLDAIAEHLGVELIMERVSPRWVVKDIWNKCDHSSGGTGCMHLLSGDFCQLKTVDRCDTACDPVSILGKKK